MSFGVKAIAIMAICALHSIEGKSLHPDDDLSRIIGGHDTTIEKYPFMAHIRYDNDLNCGGSLVTPTCVLTAAHCINLSRIPSIHTGSTKWRESKVIRYIIDMEIPKNYNGQVTGYDMDIAVVKLNEPLNDELVELDFEELLSDDNVTLIGWGFTDIEIEKVADILQEVEVTLIPTQECDKSASSLNINPEYEFCAGSKGKDSRKGDSGSPVLRNGKQVGVVSRGRDELFIGVYTKMSSIKVQDFLNEAFISLNCY